MQAGVSSLWSCAVGVSIKTCNPLGTGFGMRATRLFGGTAAAAEPQEPDSTSRSSLRASSCWLATPGESPSQQRRSMIDGLQAQQKQREKKIQARVSALEAYEHKSRSSDGGVIKAPLHKRKGTHFFSSMLSSKSIRTITTRTSQKESAKRNSLPVDVASVVDMAIQRQMEHVMDLTPWYIIDPRGHNMARWDVVTSTALAFTAIVTPFEVGLLGAPEWNALFVLNRLVDVVFITDITVHFFVMHRKQYTKAEEVRRDFGFTWEVDLRRLARDYATSWFIPDVVSVMPCVFDVLQLVMMQENAMDADLVGGSAVTNASVAAACLQVGPSPPPLTLTLTHTWPRHAHSWGRARACGPSPLSRPHAH